MSDERKDLRIKLMELGGAISACWDKATVGKFDQTRAEREVDAATDAILAAGYRRPRTIKSAAELEALPFGSAVQTADELDTVVLRCEGRDFRNQSGFEVSVETLWRFGTHPFTVIYEPEQQP